MKIYLTKVGETELRQMVKNLVCRLIHLNSIANFKNFRGKIRKWKKLHN